MGQARYSELWTGNCACGKPITFSPNKPLVQDEHEYKCSCGKDYWIDRNTGYYKELGEKS